MRISEIAKQVKDEHQCKLIRLRKGFKKVNKFDPIEYDCKDYEGSKRGWVFLDAMTANAIVACYEALNDENKAKFDSIPLTTLIQFCWKHVS